MRFVLVDLMEELVEGYRYVFEHREPEYESLRKIFTSGFYRKDIIRGILHALKSYDPNFDYYKKIVNRVADGEIKYLFMYDKRIGESELKIAKFLSEYPEERLRKISKIMVDAYFMAFKNRNKNMGDRKVVQLIYDIGFERLIYFLSQEIESRGLEISIGGGSVTPVNRQYGYDHRFDAALYLTEVTCEVKEEESKEVFENVKPLLDRLSGMIAFMNFGETPFSYENKGESLKFSEEQQNIFKAHQNRMMKISETYIPMRDLGQSCIGFPKPEIGEKFEEIFEETFEINMLDTDHYEAIQQKIIDILDYGEYVHIKGKGENKTDIVVQLQSLDPKSETNFINCGCDLNIPVGEVFTSPQLKGTNGILHIDDAFLFGKKYINLLLEFEDGFVKDYNCSNYESEEENKKYVEEGLLFPHKTLPLGEFAIGTNTLAYVMAKKYGIMEKLPILIIEKMGPHFAIGDTCFFMDEDNIIRNRFNDKLFIAAENEKSRLRKEDTSKAYTFRHTDITLPYELIEFITVVDGEGNRRDIIRDGRFVVPGTEELNIPLDRYFDSIKQ
jgi:hypothetical protein